MGVGVRTVTEYSIFSAWPSPAPSSVSPLSPGSFGVLRWAVGSSPVPIRVYLCLHIYRYGWRVADGVVCAIGKHDAGRTIARPTRATSWPAPSPARHGPRHRLRRPCVTATHAVARTASPALPVNGRVTVGRFSRRISLSPLPSEPQAPTISMRIRQGQTQYIVYNPRKGCR